MIRLVTLDFWHTLFADTQDGLRRAHALRLEGVRAALAESGRSYDPAALAAADVRAGEAFAEVWQEHRDMAPDEQLRIFLGVLDPALPSALDSTTLEPHRPCVPGAGPGAPPGDHSRTRRRPFTSCGRRGHVLGVISNTGRTPGRVLRQLLADAGLLQHFAVLAFSDERGVRKPAAAMFRWVLDAAATGSGARRARRRRRGSRHRRGAERRDASDPLRSERPPSRRRRPTACCADFAELPTLVARLGAH